MQPQNETPQYQQYAAHKPSQKSKIIFIVLAVLFAATAGVFGYLWYQENTRANQLSNEVNTLKSSDSDTPQETTPQTTTFKAEVGKFSLTLPKEHIIIKTLDGGAEGASGMTVVKIGAPNTAFAGVVDDPEYKNTTITAARASDYTTTDKTFDNWKTRIIADASAKKLEPITVDGATAETYEAHHLGTVLMAFFQKNGLWYNIQIETENVTTARTTLETTVKGFMFDS